MLATTRSRPRYLCVNCDRRWVRFSTRCLCGGIHTIQATRRDSAAATPEESRAVRADDIPDQEIERITTGAPEWDEGLGGGWAHKSKPSLLIYGGPATRKTTDALRIADRVGPTLFISTESRLERIKGYITRLRLDPRKIWCIHESDLSIILREMRATPGRYRLVVIDSITAVRERKKRGDVLQNLKRIIRAVDEDSSLIVIAQVNKDGKPTGSTEVPHEVDIVAKLTKTTIDVWKNRLGPEGKVKRPAITRL